MAAVFVSFLASLLLVLWLGRDGGISYDNKTTAMGRLALFYLPLFTLMAAFFFGKQGGRAPDTTVPLDAFLFAAAIVTLWVLTPVFFLLTFFIEDVITELPKIKPYGDSAALLGLGYYFSKDHARRRAVPRSTAPKVENDPHVPLT
jgi:hypothetical protein